MKLESLTIVFVDIKNYTSKTSDQSRTANERLLARFSSLVKPLVRAFHGTMVKALGDAFLITFKSPTDSLLCAMAVLDQLVRRNAQVAPEERFELRFAINAGEVRIDRNDVFGDAVNIAARIEALADGGEIYFSESVFLMMNRSEVPYVEVGLRKLKGIQEEIRIYRVPKVSEVGVYKLSPPNSTAWAEPDEVSPSLPFGGLALNRVHSSIISLTDPDAPFTMAAALSELHDTALSRASRFSVGFARVLAPPRYLASMGGGLLALPFRSATYRGLGLRLRKDLKQIRDSAYYRTRLLGLAALVMLGLALSLAAWHRYILVQQAEQQAELQATALRAEVQLKETAAAQAAVGEAAAQSELKQMRTQDAEDQAKGRKKNKKKGKPKTSKPGGHAKTQGFHVPWW